MMESIDQMSDASFFFSIAIGCLIAAVIVMWTENKQLKHENRSLRRRLYNRGAVL